MTATPAAQEQQPADQTDPPWPNLAYAWYVTGVLCFAYAVSFIDRQILYLLVVPIQQDLGFSDTQMSMLQGLAFGLFYTLMGLPLGRCADIWDRRVIIGIGTMLWSLMTAACGLARTFPQMFLARMGVGVGEASLSPSALSLISDYFPPQYRGAAISTYVMGNSLGAGLALVAGGAAIGWVVSWSDVTIPGYSALKPWQLTFLLAAIPGLLVTALMLTVREPVRRGLLADVPQRAPLSTVFRFVWGQRNIYLRHNLAMALMAVFTYGISSWTPTFFMRSFDWTASDVGAQYGVLVLVFGAGGVLVGGRIAQYMVLRGRRDANLRATLIAIVALVPFAIAAPLMQSETWAIILYAPATFFSTMPFGTAAAAIQEITPNQMRGQVSALYLFIISIVGTTLGATSVALLTDFVFVDPAAVGKSIAVLAAATCPIALAIMMPALKPFREANINRQIFAHLTA